MPPPWGKIYRGRQLWFEIESWQLPGGDVTDRGAVSKGAKLPQTANKEATPPLMHFASKREDSTIPTKRGGNNRSRQRGEPATRGPYALTNFQGATTFLNGRAPGVK